MTILLNKILPAIGTISAFWRLSVHLRKGSPYNYERFCHKKQGIDLKSHMGSLFLDQSLLQLSYLIIHNHIKAKYK